MPGAMTGSLLWPVLMLLWPPWVGCGLCLTDDDSLMDGLLPAEVPHPAGLRDTRVFSRRDLGERELSCWTSPEPWELVVKPELPGP